MNKQTEALKMAIEGMAKAENVFDDLGLLLIKFGVNPSDINFHKESFLTPVIQACKEALAEAEKQEVREVMDLASYGQSISTIAPKPLDDDAITAILIEHDLDNVEQAGCHIDIVKLIRDVELAHGIE